MFRPFGTPTPNVFGNQEQLQNRPQTIGFGNAPAGNTGSVFGAPQSNVFGSNTNQQQLGQSSNLFSTQSVPLVQNPRYTTTNDLEGSSTITLHSISAMPAYVTKSFEEIRLDDYLAGRKGASMSTFGNAAFSGQTPGANISTGFGDSSKPAFGQQQLASSGSFSSVAPTGSVFGGNVSTNAFGVPQSQQTFGSQQAPSLFGTRQTSSSGVFGAQSTPFSSSQAPQATSFGASIGATGATNSVFGSQQQSAFGDKPSIFGTQPSSNSLFGVQQGNNMPGNQQQATPFGVAPASTFGGSQGTFGASSTPAAAPLAPFGASSNSNLFGAQNQQQTSIGSQMFPFGSQTQQTPFGTQSGNSNQTQLFGSAQKTNFGVQSSGLFGSQQPSTFGGQQPTSLSAQHQQPSSFGTQQPGQSLSLFGTQSQQQPPLQNQQLQTSAQTNLGQQPMATKPSLFGGQSISFPSATSTVGQSSGTGFSFGGSAGAGLGTTLGSQTQPSGQSTQSQMSGLFGQSSATPAQGGLFNFNTGVQTNFGPSSQQPVTYSNLPLVDSKVLFSIKPPIPQALSTPSKLKPTEDSKKTPRSAAAQAARLNPRTAFRLYPTASSASGATSWRSQSSTKRLVVSDKDQTHHLSNANILEPEEKAAITDENNLYMTPSRSVLSHMPYSQLSAVSNFTVGCRGIGQVRFLCPVDLTKVVLDEILSKIVVFEPRQITVYPESDEDSAFTVSKPAVGSGLNLPAEVRLECCWPVNKANRQPIREMGDERMLSHISRLRSVEGTKFMDYFPETGTWVFRVEHFSTYRCPLSDKEINYELNDHSSSMSLGESLASSSSTIDSESNSCIIPLKKKHEDVQLKDLRFLRVFEEPSGHDGVLIPGCFRFGACWSADGTSLWIPRCGGEVATVRRIPCSSLWSSPVSQPIGLGVRTEVGVEKYVELNDGLVGCLPEELVDFIDYASQTMLSWGENIERKVMRKDLDSSIFIKNKTLQTDSKVPDSTGDSEINGEIRMVKDQVDARWIENDSGWMPAGVRNILEIWNLFHSGDREKLLKWLKKSVSLDVGLVSPLAHEIVTGGANAVNLVEDLQLAPLASLLYSNASTTHVRELLNQSFIEMKNKNYSNDECLIISALLGKTDDFFVAAGIPPNWKVALLIMLLYQKNKSIIDIVMVEFKGTRETSGNQENTEFLAAVLSTLSFLRSLQFRKEESSGISGDILLNSDSLNKELMSSISIKLLEGFDDYYHQFCLIYSVPGMVELLPKELHERSQRHLREYLSSLGYWHQINQFRDEYEISLYLKIEEERSLMRTSQRANYLKQEMRLKRVFGDYNLYVAYANRCKYFKCLKQAAYYLVIVGRYEEARDLLLPIILNYCKRGLDPSDDMVKDILSMFPTDLLSEFHLQFVTPRIQ